MMKIAIETIAMVVFAAQALAPASLPDVLTGKWRTGAPYNTPGPVGIDERQEKLVRAVNIQYSSRALFVCNTISRLRRSIYDHGRLKIFCRPMDSFLGYWD
jgi:hypothetical protein